MPLPKPGDPAPTFELLTDRDQTIRLLDLRGKKVVLFFYPRADTPNCTKEACGFRDDISAFKDLEVELLGISPDTVSDQAKFSNKFDLSFPLLADPDHRVAEAYGVWGPKQSFGREIMGVHRTTFVIDEQGRIDQVFEKVKAEGHSREVLEALQA